MFVELPRFPRAPAEVTCKLRQPSQANRSEFTGWRHVTILAEAPRWSFQVKYPPIIGEDAIRPWRAALAMLQGRAGTFRLYPGEGPQNVSYRSGPGVQVDGAGQIGLSVNLRGWTPGQFVRAGWFVTIGERLHQIVEQAIAGNDGKMVVKVIPYVAGYADGAPVEACRPYALVSLTEDEAGWTVGPGQRYDISFACEEAH